MLSASQRVKHDEISCGEFSRIAGHIAPHRRDSHQSLATAVLHHEYAGCEWLGLAIHVAVGSHMFFLSFG
jgi:hypothetical protein